MECIQDNSEEDLGHLVECGGRIKSEAVQQISAMSQAGSFAMLLQSTYYIQQSMQRPSLVHFEDSVNIIHPTYFPVKVTVHSVEREMCCLEVT